MSSGWLSAAGDCRTIGPAASARLTPAGSGSFSSLRSAIPTRSVRENRSLATASTRTFAFGEAVTRSSMATGGWVWPGGTTAIRTAATPVLPYRSATSTPKVSVPTASSFGNAS